MHGLYFVGVVLVSLLLSLQTENVASQENDNGLNVETEESARLGVNTDEVVPGQYIVGLSKGARSASRMRSLAQSFESGFDVRVTRNFNIGKFQALVAEAKSLDVANKLLSMPEVDFVEPNKVVRTTEFCEEQVSGFNFWGLSRLERRDALSLNDTEDSLTYSTSSTNDGTGVDVFVFDTGIRLTHKEFGGRARWGMTASDINETEHDFRGHGTHVAGTIGGATTGVAKGANLVALKVLDGNGRGTTAGILEAFEWAINDVETRYKQTCRRPKVVSNLSLGYGGRSLSADRGFLEVAEAGITMVNSAGNSARDACLHSPHSGYGIRVAASNINDNLAFFSNWGPCVDITGPGRSINSSYSTADDAYAVASGTSMSAPHVAGVVARYLSTLPEAVSPHVVKAWLLDTATRGAIEFQDYQDENTTLLQSSTPNRLLFINCTVLHP